MARSATQVRADVRAIIESARTAAGRPYESAADLYNEVGGLLDQASERLDDVFTTPEYRREQSAREEAQEALLAAEEAS